jgi:outer membrane protein TolC
MAMCIKPQVLLGLLLVAIGSGLQAQSGTILIQYDDLRRVVVGQNGYLQRDTFLIDAAEVRMGSRQRSQAPEVSASLGGEGFQTGGINGVHVQPVGSIEAIVPLYRGGLEDAEESIRGSELRLSKIQYNRTVAEQLAIVQTLYWDIVYTDEMVRNLQDVRSHNSKSYESAKRRYKRGLLPQSDLMGFEIYQSRLDENIESVQHEKKILMIKMKAELGISESASVKLAHVAIPHSHDKLVTASLQVSQVAEIKALELNALILKSRVDQVAAKGSPSIDAFGTYALYSEAERPFPNWQDRLDTSVGIRTKFLLYDGNRLQSETQSTRLQLQSLTAEAEHKARIATSELKASQEELVHLHELFHHSEIRLAQAKQFLKSTVQEYDRGVKNSTDVLTAMQFYEEVQTNYATQKRQYQKTKSDLLSKFAPELKKG